MNLNASIDKFMHGTAWLWLPFYALFHLIEKIGERKK